MAGLVPFAAGMALAGTPATTAIVSSLPESKQGVASAVNDTSRELGSALGSALLGSVLNESYRNGIREALADLPFDVPKQAADGAESSIAFVQLAVDRLGPAGQPLLEAARQSFVDATGDALTVAAGVLLLGAIYVWWRAPHRDDAPQTDQAAEAEPATTGARSGGRRARASRRRAS